MQLWWVQEQAARAAAHDLDDGEGEQHPDPGRYLDQEGGRQVSDLSFKVAKRRRDAITFDLEGNDRVYSFTPPKSADMVIPMLEAETEMIAAKAAFDWLDQGLSEDDRAHIAARLRDQDDDLDIDTVEEVVAALVERVSGRPTT
jgi:hypothetical protein